MVVCRCSTRFEVHSEVRNRNVVDEGVGQRHFESLGGTLAVLIDAHSSELPQVRVVEAGVQHVEAVGVCTVRREPEGLVVVQGSTVETFQGRKAVGV